MAQRLAVASGLARRFEAHLVGLQVHPRFEPAIHGGAGLPAERFIVPTGLREMVLGGASRTLLASMTVPVLIAH